MSGLYQVETGVRPPCDAHFRKYPFNEMSAGDSFFVSCDAEEKARGRLASAANSALGKGNFAVRRVDGGYRVWRLA